MDREEEKDLYIKAKLKDGYIPEKIDNLFNNSAKLVENIEPPKRNKNQVVLKRIAGIAACAVLVLGGGNIYATTQGYDNVFFMIKEWVAPSEDVHGKDGILSDRDITISYKSIEITKGIKMQINRLVVKDNNAKLYLKIDQAETELDITPFTYVVRDENGNEICNYASKNKEMTYTEELELQGLKKNAKKIELEVKQNDNSTLVKFDINLENKEIQVIGNEYELQKISEEELKKYLSAFALLNYEDDELNLETVSEDALEDIRNLMVAHQIAKINEQTNYEKIITGFTNAEESSTKKIEFKENIEGLCIDVTDIMYSNGIYTVTFTYCYPTTEDINKNTIEDLPLYEMTIGLTINEDQTYSKYRVSSKMESMLIRDGKDKPLVNDVSYIEIRVDNSGEDGLSYTDPLKIEDHEIIDEIKNIINNGEEITIQSAGGFWESCPMLTIYQSNGEKLSFTACDGFEMEGEPSGNLLIFHPEDDSSIKIFKTDKELGECIEKIYDNNIDSTKVGDYFILYDGAEIEKNTGIQDISDMEITDEANKKYNTTYYNYENGKYFGTSAGTFGEETYEGRSIVMTPKRIAISERYNAIPREYETIVKLPEELIDMADCTTVDIQAIDLDGDGKKEYIVCWTLSYKEGEIGDGNPVASSGIMLFDNNYKKVADLVTLDDGFWGNSEDNKVFLSIEDVEYIDIDNDRNMEVIIRIPKYEGSTISIIKYKNGIVEGETDIKASVEP